MCSALVCVDVAARRRTETQNDGQRNVLELNAAGILWLSRHRSMNQFSVDLAANDKSCTISHHVSNVSLDDMSHVSPLAQKGGLSCDESVMSYFCSGY